jgi:hypothetical protein
MVYQKKIDKKSIDEYTSFFWKEIHEGAKGISV